MTEKGKTKRTSKPKSPAKSKAAPKKTGPGWKKRVWQIGWKAGLTFCVLFVCYGLYLNHLVKLRFSGQLFELPTVVYARILSLTPGDNISLATVRKELDQLNYRKVRTPKLDGEYSSSSTKIELIRRPFEFADGPEPDRHVMLHFDASGLTRIQSLESAGDLGFLRLEPKMLGMLEKNVTEQRLYLRREQFPEVMIDALLATEDRHFYQHDGVSPVAILRALVVNVKAGRTVQGGSTLTQQLAKNLFLSSERSLLRKMREAYMALIIDYRYSKDRILEGYLNEVYLGQNGAEAIHGFGLAARLYFGQPLQELRIDQLAMLVGMVKGPSYYNPIRYPERAKQRRDLVLKLMLNQDILTAKQYQIAVNRNLDVSKDPRIAARQPAYFQQVSRELKEKVGDGFKSDKGLRVFTSLDPISQSELEKAANQTLSQLNDDKLQVAAVAVARQSGEIRAMVGGKDARFDGFNRALNASRQIGSLAKPAVFLSALSQPEKYSLATTLEDKPLALKSSNGEIWEPQNFERSFRGKIPLYESLVHSVNVPTVRLGMSLGIKTVAKTLTDLGVAEKEIRPVPSMFLGAFALSPLEVAQMYQTVANTGRLAPLSALRSVVDLNGNVLYQSLPKTRQSVPAQAAWLTTYAMQRVVEEGTGRRLKQRFDDYHLAGKTGTSNDGRDSWFVGIDGREVTTVWVGRDDDKATGLTGATGALRVYDRYLQHRGAIALSLPRPDNIVTVGYSENRDGSLALQCRDDFKLPVWDYSKKVTNECEKQSSGLGWLKRLFGS